MYNRKFWDFGQAFAGDIVLADRGFDISDSVGLMQAKLHIPVFTKGKSQLSALEVHETRKIANVRINDEHVIGNVRQKYSILQSTLPIYTMLIKKSNKSPILYVVHCVMFVIQLFQKIETL